MRLNRLASALALSASLVALGGCFTDGATPSEPTGAAQPAWGNQLIEDVRILAADDMEGRDTGAAGGERARNYIVGRFEAMGIAAPAVGRLQPWALEGGRGENRKTWNGINVMGLIPGTRVSNRYIVVTAHYDHVGMDGGQIHNGADDNASGVASMLELARRLKETPPEHSVLFVALDGEERGLLGAKHFVEAPPMPLSSIAMNLNLDMTARAETDGKLWVTGTYQNPTFRPLLEPIGARGAVSLAFGKDTPQDTGANNWVMASDHGMFHRANVPFIYLGVDFHPDYHQPTDDLDRITPSYFISATELVVDSFFALDRGLDR